jgi:methylenetetrahydrofolate reductase (NADPH)
MKISDILQKKTALSFEIFPPKEDRPLEPLLDTLSHLYAFDPDFISCTYGAGGTNKGRSLEVAEAIKQSGHEALPHITCVGSGRDEIEKFVCGCVERGAENILALRGDFPAGWEGTQGDFNHADELLEFLREKFPELCFAVAGYPEKHTSASSFEKDIEHLKSKQTKGAQFIITQLCHDVDAYKDYVDRIRRAGVHIPVVAGLMPVLNRDVIIRITLQNGCSIPAELAAIIGKYDTKNGDFKKAGIEYTVKQTHRFREAGIAGLHLYTMNKWEDIVEIVNVSEIRKSTG